MRPGVGRACARMSPSGQAGQPANQKEAKNIPQHGGHFEKLIAWVFVNHHEDVIYKKCCQNPMICFPAVGHFENSCQHGGHFEKLIA